MTVQSKIDFRPMQGFLLIENIVSMREPEILPPFLSGEYDIQLKSAFYFQQQGKQAETIEELDNDNLTLQKLEHLKNVTRKTIQTVADRLEEDVNRHSTKQAKQNFKEQNKVSQHGTVSEISNRYQISKKQVRKMKIQGTLDDFISKQ